MFYSWRGFKRSYLSYEWRWHALAGSWWWGIYNLWCIPLLKALLEELLYVSSIDYNETYCIIILYLFLFNLNEYFAPISNVSYDFWDKTQAKIMLDSLWSTISYSFLKWKHSENYEAQCNLIIEFMRTTGLLND